MKRILAIALLFAGCSQPELETTSSVDTVLVNYDTIPDIRTTVKEQPVASYSQPVADELNDWKFAVYAYETRHTFRYLLRMQYKELRVTDSIEIPNFGIRPEVMLRKGPEQYSCVIGFADKKGDFKEFRKAFVKNDQFRFVSVANYYAGKYKTRVKSE